MTLIYWVTPRPENDADVSKIKITRSDRPDGTYETVATISPASVGGVFTTEYIDTTGEKYHWYIMEFQNASDQTITKSDPRKGEPTFASVIELMWRLRTRMGDFQKPYCFSDSELLDILNEAKITANKNLSWDELNQGQTNSEAYEQVILWLALHQVCLLLATDSAKFFTLSIEGIVVNKGERVAYYTDLAEKYWNKAKEKVEEWKLGNIERSGTIQEAYMTRESGTTGRRVSYIHAMPPEPVRLRISHVTAGSVDLYWSQNFDPGYYYTVIFRSPYLNVQKPLIEDIYHKRIAALYNDITDYQPLWGNATIPIRTIYRNSVTYWQDQNRVGLVNPYYPNSIPMLYPGRTFYYVVGTVNKNMLIALSNEEKVTMADLSYPMLRTPIYASDSVIEGQCEPTATVHILKNGVEISAQQVGPGYPFFRVSSGLVVGDKIKTFQEFVGITSPTSPEYTVVA